MKELDKAKVQVYCIIGEACSRVKRGDKQWNSDPNHFLLELVDQIFSLKGDGWRLAIVKRDDNWRFSPVIWQAGDNA